MIDWKRRTEEDRGWGTEEENRTEDRSEEYSIIYNSIINTDTYTLNERIG